MIDVDDLFSSPVPSFFVRWIMTPERLNTFILPLVACFVFIIRLDFLLHVQLARFCTDTAVDRDFLFVCCPLVLSFTFPSFTSAQRKKDEGTLLRGS